jgi:ribonucleoside-triphosphate reductase
LYATPAETTVYHFNTKDRERYENVNGIFDHKYYTNSFHINVRTPIDAISKLEKEAEFQKISS